MENKILSICIAAYNAENYISEAIESCIVNDYIEDVEVIVIDDGSTDHTGIIADWYQERYLGCIQVIHKGNGGYGSAVNEGMKCARGRYFKILDADDQFDRDGFIKLLHMCQKEKADVLLTKTIDKDIRTKMKKYRGDWDEKTATIHTSKEVDIKDASMHMITVKTSLLKKYNDFLLPSKIHYTDTLYSLHVMSIANTFILLPYAVYIYSLGREEQSMSSENLKRNVGEINKILKLSLDYYMKLPKEKRRENIVRSEIRIVYSTMIECLMHMKKNRKIYRKIIEKEHWISSIDDELSNYIASNTRKIRFLRSTHYLGYWFVAGHLMDIIHPLGS